MCLISDVCDGDNDDATIMTLLWFNGDKDGVMKIKLCDDDDDDEEEEDEDEDEDEDDDDDGGGGDNDGDHRQL